MSESKGKNRIFEIVQLAEPGDRPSRVFDLLIISLILLNVAVVIADTFTVAASIRIGFFVIEVISILIFTIEYICRIWTADKLYPELTKGQARRKYIFSGMALIDLVAILPFYLIVLIPGIPPGMAVLRIVRVARLARLFKLKRYSNTLGVIGIVLKSKAKLLLSAISVVGLMMLISALLMFYVENEAQPDQFANVFDALWWAIVTMSTVGYGNIVPITVLGRVFASITILLGIGLLAVPTGIISAGFIEHINAQQRAEEEAEKEAKPAKEYCPYCGEKLD